MEMFWNPLSRPSRFCLIYGRVNALFSAVSLLRPGVNVAAALDSDGPNNSVDLPPARLSLLTLSLSRSFKLPLTPLLPMPSEVSASGSVLRLAISFWRMKF